MATRFTLAHIPFKHCTGCLEPIPDGTAANVTVTRNGHTVTIATHEATACRDAGARNAALDPTWQTDPSYLSR